LETGSKARFIEQKDQASGAVPMPRGSRPSMAALTRSAGLPRMDGMETFRRLRQKSDLPVIFPGFQRGID